MKLCRATTLLTALFLLIVSVDPVSAQTDPASAFAALQEAVDRRDVEGALSLFADDAVVRAGPRSFAGRGAIRNYLESLVSQNYQREWESTAVVGESIRVRGRVSSHLLRAFNTPALDVTVEADVRGDRIHSMTVGYTLDLVNVMASRQEEQSIQAAADASGAIVLMVATLALASLARRASWRIAPRVAETIAVVGVLVASLSVFGQAASQVSFHIDESAYIWRARYFDYLFVRHDLGRSDWGDQFTPSLQPTIPNYFRTGRLADVDSDLAVYKWGDNYWTHTHPMLANFIVGGWLWTRGYDLNQMPRPTTPWKTREENRLDGRGPDDVLLSNARAPMVALAAGGVTLLYLLGRVLSGSLAGLTAAALALASPLLQENLVRAVSDPPLQFFALLALLLTVLGAQRGRTGGLPFRWAIPVGVALGLTFATKLTAVLGLLAIVAWGILVAILAARRRSPPAVGGRIARASSAGRGWATALAVAVAVFVLANPHLYPDPIRHTKHLFEHRAGEMVVQRLYRAVDRGPRGDADTLSLDPVFTDAPSRLGYVFERSFIGGTATGAAGLPVEALLAVLGAITLSAKVWQAWRRTGQPPVGAVVLLTALVYSTGIAATIHIPIPRYLVLALILGCLLSGVGGSAIVRRLSKLRLRPKSGDLLLLGRVTRPS